MTIQQSIKLAEAIIFASGSGITKSRLIETLELDNKQFQFILDTLQEKYDMENSGIVLSIVEDTVCFISNIEAGEYVKKALIIKRNTQLSNAAMETLAIIAYNQPISRAFVEQVRGVDSVSSIKTLMDRGLVEEAGRLDIPGRPISYKTTPIFLRSFSLTSLEQLPKIKSSTALNLNSVQLEEDDEYNP